MILNAVATPHHLTAGAAREIIEAGGNAVDAAIAAIVTQGVVAPETCGLGGDLFALVHQPGWERPRALNASGRAGSNADPEELRAAGHTEVPRDHPLTVTIPGCVDGVVTLAAELGSMSIADLLEPARRLASAGFEVSTEQERAFTGMSAVYMSNPAVASFYPEGRVARRGETVRRPELAATLAAIQASGRDGFYLGTPGEDIVDAAGGRITPGDLIQGQGEWVEPVGVTLGDRVAWTTPPNSQGYLGPATLSVFGELGPGADVTHPMFWHLLIEAYRCLAWERNDVVADERNAPLPLSILLDRERLQRAASTVQRDRAGVWPRHIGSEASGTAYLCVSDSKGTAVSIIQSNYRGTGSHLGARRSGFLLQDRGGGFSLMPGHPNEMAPGKRPLHTLSPTLWVRGGETSRVLGTRGGSIQPQLVAQMAARVDHAGSTIGEAQSAPRWSVADFGPGSPPVIRFEPGMASKVLRGLEEKGHRVEVTEGRMPGWGPVSMVDLDSGGPETAPDPRVDTTTALIF